MFEGDTFLVMAKSGSPLDCETCDFDDTEVALGYNQLDKQRFEKISELIKSFRKTCQRTGETFVGFESQFDGITIVLEPLTRNTFVLVVSTDPRSQVAMIKYNVQSSQLHFAEIATHTKFQRKCGICREAVKTVTNAAYDSKDDDEPSVRAWDDVGIDLSSVARS
jgi:Ras-related GTP-binding protein A/B